MTYDSLEVIPLKIFLKILKTKNFTLLGLDPKEVLNSEKIWNQMEQEFKKLDPDNNMEDLLKTLTKLSKYTAQYNAIKISVQAIRFERDLDLENLIRSQGFQLTEANFSSDLQRVDLEVESIQLLINEQRAKLPKKSKDSKEKAQNIDEVILGYCSITGLQFDTNLITVTQFYALKKLFDQKAQSMKDQRDKNKKRK